MLADTIKSCAATSNIKLGKCFHSRLLKLGMHSCLGLSKALLNMYAKCRALDDCRLLFNQISNPDGVTWNIMLWAFAATGVHDTEVMNLYRRHPEPTSVTVAVVLPVCVRLRGLTLGKTVHSYVIKSGLESQTLVGNALVSMYLKLGNVSSDAYKVFDDMSERDVVSWNAMVAGLAANGLVHQAFGIFRKMVLEGTGPNYATIANILPVCALLEGPCAYQFGKEIHCYALRRPEVVADVSVVNALVGFYSKIGQMGQAESLFHRMLARDLVSWNSIIAGYTSNGEWVKGLELFRQFNHLELVDPDRITFLTALHACAHLQNLQAGKQIHGYIVRRPTLSDATAVGNSLINFYSKCGDSISALASFSSIINRDLISWNSILDSLAMDGHVSEFLNHLHCMFMQGIKPDSITILTAIQLGAELLQLGMVKEAHGFSLKSGLLVGTFEPTLGNALIAAYAKCDNMDYASNIFACLSGERNVVTCNSLISGYLSCGAHDTADALFKNMSERDLTTWNLMIRAYAVNGYPDQALNLVRELQNHETKPDNLTIMSILPVSTQMASVQMLRQCHGYVVRARFDDDQLTAALLDAYAKCGSIHSACKLFESTPRKDLVMFTSMIGGYAMHGMGHEALGIYFRMLELGVKPDHVVITTVLSACSHSGLVDEGLKAFFSTRDVKPTMEQYGCVVDLLGRGGRIGDAYSFVASMPVEPTADVWGTLLGACRNHQEVEMGCVVADHLLKMEANSLGDYVVVSNIYAAKAKWEDVVEIRRLMKSKDLKKSAGCSWIEVDGRNNVFVAGDTSHPLRRTINDTLYNLDKQVRDRESKGMI